MNQDFPDRNKAVKVWLLIGIVMVFFQVLIGGVTRLTDSGLSITDWSVIQGTIPPLNVKEWNEAFELYKVHAYKQYNNLHSDMSLAEFKVIYFWEYFHRLWARLMGFVFLIPFLIFLRKKWIPKWLVKDLSIVILLAALAAVFGWIMVASGLNEDNRTWVSAYKLLGHLGIATALFSYLVWTFYKYINVNQIEVSKWISKLGWIITGLLLIQIGFGGLMAGMRAGLIHPYWPWFIEFSQLKANLYATSIGNNEIVNYETSVSIKAWIQVFHRFFAYLLSASIFYWCFVMRRLGQKNIRIAIVLLITLLITQFTLGILTVINSFGSVPVLFGAAHQVVALVLFAIILYLNRSFRVES